MNHQIATRLRIEKAVYDKGINVALRNAERTDRFKDFQSDVEDALNAQIAAIADDASTVDTLIMLAKAAESPLTNQLKALLSKFSIGTFIDPKTYLVWAGEQGGQAALDKNGVLGVFGLTNPKLIEYFCDYANLLISSVDNTTKDWIANKIQEGKDKGLTPGEIQKLLIDDGKAISAIRAERIVLTETARAMTTIELEFARRFGFTEKTWRTSRDERVCPICGPLDGTRIPLDAQFEAIRSTKTKGDTITLVVGPPAHVSCRCYEQTEPPENWRPPGTIWTGE